MFVYEQRTRMSVYIRTKIKNYAIYPFPFCDITDRVTDLSYFTA